MKLGQGNVFTGVCDSVHRGGLPQCMLGYNHHPPPDPPAPGSRAPPGPDPQSRHPPGSRHPLVADTPHPSGADTPQEQTPQSRHPPETRHPPGADTPPQEQITPGSRLRHTVNERPVRILLECILVFNNQTS